MYGVVTCQEDNRCSGYRETYLYRSKRGILRRTTEEARAGSPRPPPEGEEPCLANWLRRTNDKPGGGGDTTSRRRGGWTACFNTPPGKARTGRPPPSRVVLLVPRASFFAMTRYDGVSLGGSKTLKRDIVRVFRCLDLQIYIS
jgi:hypothetical protein